MANNIRLPHTCPHCKKVTANTPQVLQRLFGFRANSQGHVITQSWCMKCRSGQ
ncbi:TPA: hypothetical protein ACX6R4_000830 [Photobacterium damselae]